jgi:hypothetical protein
MHLYTTKEENIQNASWLLHCTPRWNPCTMHHPVARKPASEVKIQVLTTQRFQEKGQNKKKKKTLEELRPCMLIRQKR